MPPSNLLAVCQLCEGLLLHLRTRRDSVARSLLVQKRIESWQSEKFKVAAP